MPEALTSGKSSWCRNTVRIKCSDVSLSVNDYIEIDNEEMYIKEKSGNTIKVNRGQDETQIVSHVVGAVVNIINNADDALIEQDDDFGFSEYRYDYGDGKTYSPTKGIDV